MALSKELVGKRTRVPGSTGSSIGIAAKEFRAIPPLEPSGGELANYSSNPRNAYGDWYQDRIETQLRGAERTAPWKICSRDEAKSAMGAYSSPVYASRKIPDLVVRDAPGKRKLGLELKYLHGDGSLVRPKTLIDAIDFSHRPLDCIYVIDGPGWLKPGNVEYLERWWQFSCSARLNETLSQYFGE